MKSKAIVVICIAALLPVAKADVSSAMRVIESLSDRSSLSHRDTVALREYVLAVQEWLLSEGRATEQSVDAESEKLLSMRTALEVAKMGECAHLIARNRQLVSDLEIQSGILNMVIEDNLNRRESAERRATIAKVEDMVVASVRSRAKRLPELDIVNEEKKAAEPGATDNPDDAQRLREDH